MARDTRKFRCSEIWGGNRRASEDIELGRLQGYLLSVPHESDRGGDIYCLSLCDPETISKIVVADVAGHGEVASAVASELRTLLRQNLNEVDNSKLLFSVNDMLRRKLPHGKFVTMVAATYNGEKGDLIYAYAGHPTLFRFNSSTGRWRFLQPVEEPDSGVPLGILGNTEYVQMKSRLNHGDMLLFYTDGLLDIRKNPRERLNVDGLLEACQKVTTPHHGPRLMATSLLKHIEETCEGDLTDDVTLLVLAVK